MELLLKRIYKGDKYTIGKLYIDGGWFCDTLEDKDRGLTSNMSESEIKKIKVLHETAIPTGTYNITLKIKSPKFSKYSFYQNVCSGKLPRLLNVKGFEGILIHVGEGYNGKDLTSGCILVGENKIIGGLLNGKQTFQKLYNELLKDKNNIIITIE